MLDTNVPKLRVEGPIPFTRSNFLHTSSKLLSGRAGHVIRKFAYVSGRVLCGVGCIACICSGSFFESFGGSGHLVDFRSGTIRALNLV